MNESNDRQRHIEDVIARGKALVREARLVLERSRRELQYMGIDPQRELQKLMDEGGEEAVAKAQAQAQQMLDAVQADTRHEPTPVQTPAGNSRHTRLRPNRV